MFFLRLKKLSQIILDPSLISALLKGLAAGVEHSLVLKSLNCEYIVDIGANCGQFALVARKVFPKARIQFFEPLAEPIRIFKRVFERDPNVTLYPYAIGRDKTSSTIYVTEDDASSSILPITKMQSEMFPGTAVKEIRHIEVYPISQLIDPVCIPSASLLKIDVQGFELAVLQGCQNILHKYSHLYIEWSFVELYNGQALADEVRSWLSEFGFALRGIYNMYYNKDGIAIQGDFLFYNLSEPRLEKKTDGVLKINCRKRFCY